MLKHLRSAAILVLLLSGMAFATPTLPQVYHMVTMGDISGADSAMHEVLKTHPDSARAHFVYATILQKEGNNSKAISELKEAQKLAPGLPFVAPTALTRLQQQLGIVTATPPTKSHTVFWIIVVLLGASVLVVGLILWVNDSNRRWRESYEPQRRRDEDDSEPRHPGATRESYPYPHQADPETRLRSTSTYVPDPRPYNPPPVQSGPTIINNNDRGSGGDMFTGMMLGEALSRGREGNVNNNSTTIIEREPERREEPERYEERRDVQDSSGPVEAAAEPEPAPDPAPEVDPAPTGGGWGGSDTDQPDNFGVDTSSDEPDTSGGNDNGNGGGDW